MPSVRSRHHAGDRRQVDHVCCPWRRADASVAPAACPPRCGAGRTSLSSCAWASGTLLEACSPRCPTHSSPPTSARFTRRQRRSDQARCALCSRVSSPPMRPRAMTTCVQGAGRGSSDRVRGNRDLSLGRGCSPAAAVNAATSSVKPSTISDHASTSRHGFTCSGSPSCVRRRSPPAGRSSRRRQ